MQQVLVVLVIGAPVLGGRHLVWLVVSDVGALLGAVGVQGRSTQSFLHFCTEWHGAEAVMAEVSYVFKRYTLGISYIHLLHCCVARWRRYPKFHTSLFNQLVAWPCVLTRTRQILEIPLSLFQRSPPLLPPSTHIHTSDSVISLTWRAWRFFDRTIP